MMADSESRVAGLDAPSPTGVPRHTCSQRGVYTRQFGPHESIWKMIKRARERGHIK